MNNRLVAPLWISALCFAALSSLSAALATQPRPLLLMNWSCIAAAATLVAWRWDKRLHAPDNILAISLLTSAALCGIAGTVWEATLLSSLSLPLTAGSFLSSHYERKGKRRLTNHLAPFAVAICIPNAVGIFLDNAGQRAVLSQTESLLAFFSIPYFVLQPANTIFIKTDFVSIESVWYSWASWHFLVGCILFHQACLRRSGIVLFLNSLLAIPLIVLLQTTAIFSRLASSEWYGVDLGAQSAWTICLATCVIIALIAFVSAERFLLGLSYPIASSFETTQANPMVVIWNRLFAAKSRESESDREVKRFRFSGLVAPISVAGIAIASVMQLARLPSTAARPELAEFKKIAAASPALSNVFEETPVFREDFPDRPTSTIGPRSTWLFPHLVQPITLTLFQQPVNLEEAIQHCGFHSWNIVREEKYRDASAAPIEVIEMSSPQGPGTIVTLLAHVDAEGKLVQDHQHSLAEEEKASIWSVQMTVHSMLPDGDTNLEQLASVLQLASAATLTQ